MNINDYGISSKWYIGGEVGTLLQHLRHFRLNDRSIEHVNGNYNNRFLEYRLQADKYLDLYLVYPDVNSRHFETSANIIRKTILHLGALGVGSEYDYYRKCITIKETL